MLGDAKLLRQFADRQKRAGVFCPAVAKPQPFAIRSRMIWLARKVITRRGAIGTSMPVLGLRPTRWPLSRRMKVPKPETLTFVPSDKRVAHVVQHALDDARRFGARQAEPAMDDVGQVGARQRAVGVRFIVDPRDPEIGHLYSPALNGVPPPFQLRFRNGIPSVGNSTFA